MLRRLYEILDLAPDHLAVLHREIADVRPPLRRAHLVHRVEFDADIQQAWHPVTDERLAIANRGHAVAGERLQIGRAACRERGYQYVKISVVAVSLKKKTTNNRQDDINVIDTQRIPENDID